MIIMKLNNETLLTYFRFEYNRECNRAGNTSAHIAHFGVIRRLIRGGSTQLTQSDYI